MQTKRKLIGGGVLMTLFGALAISVAIRAQWAQTIDVQTKSAFSTLISSRNTAVFRTIAFLGSPLIVLIATGLLCMFLWPQDRHASLVIGLIQLGGSGLVEVCKYIVQRPRPTHQLIADTGFSFPSGHTFCTTILILSLLFVFLPRIQDQEIRLAWTLVGILWIGLVAFSRVYLGDHYATDVLGSVLLASGFWLVVRSQENKLILLSQHFLPQVAHERSR